MLLRTFFGLIMLGFFALITYIELHALFFLIFSLIVVLALLEWNNLNFITPFDYALSMSIALGCIGFIFVDRHFFEISLPILQDNLGIMSLLTCILWLVLGLGILLQPRLFLRFYQIKLVYWLYFVFIICAFWFIESLWPQYYLVILLAIGYDTGGYFVGKVFGKRPFMPHISPNKTLEGFYGGIACSLLFGSIFWYFELLPFENYFFAALVSLLVSGMTCLGDLIESQIKRWAQLKDSSNLIPGHGGVLDRIDGHLAAIPLYTFFIHL